MPELDQQQRSVAEDLGAADPVVRKVRVTRPPPDASSTLSVETLDDGMDHTKVRWALRGTNLPARGDLGVAVFDEAGDAYLAVWNGASEGGPVGPDPDAPYQHVQSTPSALWTIGHGIGHHPVIVVEIDGEVVIPTVKHFDANTATVTHTAACSGVAYAYP